MNKILNVIAIMAICAVTPVLGNREIKFINYSQTSDIEVTFKSVASGTIVQTLHLFVWGLRLSDRCGQPMSYWNARGSNIQKVSLPLEPLLVTVVEIDVDRYGKKDEPLSFELNTAELGKIREIKYTNKWADLQYTDGTFGGKKLHP